MTDSIYVVLKHFFKLHDDMPYQQIDMILGLLGEKYVCGMMVYLDTNVLQTV